MIRNIAGQSLLQVGLIGLVLLFPMGMTPHSQNHYTFLYTVFVLYPLFNLINARATEKGENPMVGVLDTPLFLGIMAGILIVQVLLVQYVGEFVSCSPLTKLEWLKCTLFAGLTIPVGWIIRALPFERGDWPTDELQVRGGDWLSL
jgi:hypothetical protein